MKKRYFIYTDILGFEKLPKKIAEETGFEEDSIRERYLTNPLKQKVEEIEKTGTEISHGKSEIEKGSDNYILMIDTRETALETIGTLITIRISHKDYGYIPLEVGLGTEEIDEGAEIAAINKGKVIHFLKNDIITPYRHYYEKKNGHPVEETFILFTENLFSELEPLDKKFCEKVSCKGKTFYIADKTEILQRCKIFDFLQKIGYPNSRTYGRIDEVYVSPVEYEDIKETLQKERIVFITGTQEYGKTYTAVRLMWEYYLKGYEPVWIKGREERERVNVRKRLEEIRAELNPNHIIYFEDPFGKTRYEESEALEKEIGIIIECVRREGNAYVILTSREEVFKEFKKEKLSKKDIRAFEKSLNLKTPSYGSEKRKEMLAKWAESEGCTWFGSEKLRDSVLERIEDKNILPTPLRIRDFAFDTVGVDGMDQLEEKIKEKSEEVAMAFSKEIKSMSDDKILFLSFLFISERFEVGFVRELYDEMVTTLHIREAWEFDRVLNWFRNDKVNIGEFLRFSHPAYSEALQYLLVENGYITRINEEIFSRLLVNLSRRDGDAVIYVAAILMKVLNKLPVEKRKEIIFEISERYEAACDSVRSMNESPSADRSKKPSEGIEYDPIINLSQMDAAARVLVKAMVRNLDILTEDEWSLLTGRLQFPYNKVIFKIP